eukprot:GHVQ01010035.1.p1 GENE.GHVQ01010035.1~~GHVQ01010035.1.p1  ORF type:complete len:566 (+),score=93.45 GHVQ01010035.1:145-1842(+)
MKLFQKLFVTCSTALWILCGCCYCVSHTKVRMHFSDCMITVMTDIVLMTVKNKPALRTELVPLAEAVGGTYIFPVEVDEEDLRRVLTEVVLSEVAQLYNAFSIDDQIAVCSLDIRRFASRMGPAVRHRMNGGVPVLKGWFSKLYKGEYASATEEEIRSWHGRDSVEGEFLEDADVQALLEDVKTDMRWNEKEHGMFNAVDLFDGMSGVLFSWMSITPQRNELPDRKQLLIAPLEENVQQFDTALDEHITNFNAHTAEDYASLFNKALTKVISCMAAMSESVSNAECEHALVEVDPLSAAVLKAAENRTFPETLVPSRFNEFLTQYVLQRVAQWYKDLNAEDKKQIDELPEVRKGDTAVSLVGGSLPVLSEWFEKKEETQNTMAQVVDEICGRRPRRRWHPDASALSSDANLENLFEVVRRKINPAASRVVVRESLGGENERQDETDEDETDEDETDENVELKGEELKAVLDLTTAWIDYTQRFTSSSTGIKKFMIYPLHSSDTHLAVAQTLINECFSPQESFTKEHFDIGASLGYLTALNKGSSTLGEAEKAETEPPVEEEGVCW